MKIYTFIFFFLLLNNLVYLGQIHNVEKPTFQSKNIVSSFHSYQMAKNNIQTNFQEINSAKPMLGMTAKDVMVRANQQALDNMGYKPPPTEADIQAELQAKRNNANRLNVQSSSRSAQSRQIVYDALKEDNYRNNQIKGNSNKLVSQYKFSNPNSETYQNNIEFFRTAFQDIESMLSGKQVLNIKKAVYALENVVNKNQISYEDYNKDIELVKGKINQIAKEQDLNLDKSLGKHFAIQKLFSESVEQGYSYDFDDPYGNTDYQKMFVTKLLKSGKGQCRSMPLLYMILAEELNVDAYLSYAPKHSFVMFQEGGQFYNFETTNGSLTSNKFVAGSGRVKVEAIKSKIYMHPVNKKQAIARLLVHLSYLYRDMLGFDDFSKQMIETSLKYYQGVGAMMELANIETAFMDRALSHKGYPPLEQLNRFPNLSQQLNQLKNRYDQLINIGYVEISEYEYEKWLYSMQEEAQLKTNKELQLKRNRIDK
jgi:hypothetical protein